MPRAKYFKLLMVSLILMSCLVSMFLLTNSKRSEPPVPAPVTSDKITGTHYLSPKKNMTHYDLYTRKKDKKRRSGHDFEIIVLTMNRATSLQRLLTSIENTLYDGDAIKLSVKVDHAEDNDAVVACARRFRFSHGPVVVSVAKTNRGLRDSWLQAVSPTERGKVVIFEDDVDVSLVWYRWLKRAWESYEPRTDIAGITLYRQTLIPRYPTQLVEIVNNHEPFLYSLVGSIGFSPHPVQWSKFLNWVTHNVDLKAFDFSIPNIVYTYWWREGKRKQMWTQTFIYYSIFHNLYTLHINLPHNKTLVSDMRERGVHFPSTFGRDFSLATMADMDMVFPDRLVRYGFGGQLLRDNESSLSSLH